jgi:5'-nucleotidase / UDP-sugar diphosphatase
VQTVYDVFAVAPLGAGVVDTTAGSALVTAYFTGEELKHLLEFMLVDNPAHPGEYFPRSSGMRFRYDPSRPKFDVVTAIGIGDLDHGYRAIDIAGKDARLYSLTCPLYLGVIVVAIPKYTKGQLALVPKNKEGQPLTSRVEALDDPRSDTPYLLPPPGTVDKGSIATGAGKTLSGRSRSGRRSWITFAVCRSKARANYPRSRSMKGPRRCGRSKQADRFCAE